jgi:hypothetical protein
MAAERTWNRTIASYVSPRAWAPRTRAALEGLGYRVVAAATRGRFGDDSWDPDVRLVDERHLGRIPLENYLPRTPVVLVTGRRPLSHADPRVIGSVARPCTLQTLFPVLQRGLESHPRSGARAPTQIQARCTHADRRWNGALVSLSPQGCLFHTGQDMPEGLELNMLFPLPLGRMVSTRARVVRRHGDRIGMQFTGASGTIRQALADYVEERLATQISA